MELNSLVFQKPQTGWLRESVKRFIAILNGELFLEFH
jgi:hypothetical protein